MIVKPKKKYIKSKGINVVVRELEGDRWALPGGEFTSNPHRYIKWFEKEILPRALKSEEEKKGV